jgi:cytidylate kinase
MFAGATVPHELTAAEEEAFRAATEEVLREQATTGAVILGRAGALVLRDVPHALHVRLRGSRTRRIAQAMRLESLDKETAERDFHRSDVSREAYVRRWYRVDPDDPALYHLVIDSTSIDPDACVDLVVRALAGRAVESG